MPRFFVWISALCLIGIGCHHQDAKQSVKPVMRPESVASPVAKDTLTSRMESSFLVWVRDTLAKYQGGVSAFSKANGLREKTLFLPKDSLGFRVTYHYNLEIDPSKRYRLAEVRNTLALLREVKEIPKDIFNLRFTVVYDYFPSEIPQSSFGEYSYVDTLELITDHGKKNERFLYLRGRLKEKIVTSVNTGKIEERVRFSWNAEDWLVKERTYYKH